MNRIDGVRFATAWPSRIRVRLQTRSGVLPATYIDSKSLLKNNVLLPGRRTWKTRATSPRNYDVDPLDQPLTANHAEIADSLWIWRQPKRL